MQFAKIYCGFSSYPCKYQGTASSWQGLWALPSLPMTTPLGGSQKPIISYQHLELVKSDSHGHGQVLANAYHSNIAIVIPNPL